VIRFAGGRPLGSGPPPSLQGKVAIGHLREPRIEGGGSLVEDHEARLARLADRAGLDLQRTVVEWYDKGGLDQPIEERKGIADVIQAIADGEAEIVVTEGPSSISPKVGEFSWFGLQIAAAGGKWWEGGVSLIPPDGDRPSFSEELDRFAEEIERAGGSADAD
jgi:hypothetical protein